MTSIVFFFIFIPILSVILLLVNFIFAPHKPYKEKKTPFECGYHSFLAQNRSQFTISFFVFALLFLLFDLEIVLIYPYTVSSYANNIYGLVGMLLFTFILTLGFVYELGKNALKIDTKEKSYFENSSKNDLNQAVAPLQSGLIPPLNKRNFFFFNITKFSIATFFIRIVNVGVFGFFLVKFNMIGVKPFILALFSLIPVYFFDQVQEKNRGISFYITCFTLTLVLSSVMIFYDISLFTSISFFTASQYALHEYFPLNLHSITKNSSANKFNPQDIICLLHKIKNSNYATMGGEELFSHEMNFSIKKPLSMNIDDITKQKPNTGNTGSSQLGKTSYPSTSVVGLGRNHLNSPTQNQSFDLVNKDLSKSPILTAVAEDSSKKRKLSDVLPQDSIQPSSKRVKGTSDVLTTNSQDSSYNVAQQSISVSQSSHQNSQIGANSIQNILDQAPVVPSNVQSWTGNQTQLVKDFLSNHVEYSFDLVPHFFKDYFSLHYPVFSYYILPRDVQVFIALEVKNNPKNLEIIFPIPSRERDYLLSMFDNVLHYPKGRLDRTISLKTCLENWTWSKSMANLENNIRNSQMSCSIIPEEQDVKWKQISQTMSAMRGISKENPIYKFVARDTFMRYPEYADKLVLLLYDFNNSVISNHFVPRVIVENFAKDILSDPDKIKQLFTTYPVKSRPNTANDLIDLANRILVDKKANFSLNKAFYTYLKKGNDE